MTAYMDSYLSIFMLHTTHQQSFGNSLSRRNELDSWITVFGLAIPSQHIIRKAEIHLNGAGKYRQFQDTMRTCTRDMRSMYFFLQCLRD